MEVNVFSVFRLNGMMLVQTYKQQAGTFTLALTHKEQKRHMEYRIQTAA
jgi:hypothetical protein